MQEMSDRLRPPMGLILDAPYSSIAEAALTHPSAFVFRLPYVRELLVQSLFEVKRTLLASLLLASRSG